MFTEDPVRYKETLDLAVIAPEVARAFPGRFRVGVLFPDVARKVAKRYGFARWPALVLLKDGEYVGAIDGLRNWDEYLEADAAAAGRRSRHGHRPWAFPSIPLAAKRPRAVTEHLIAGKTMKSFPVPVRMVGAGSHVEEEELQYLDMPRDMRTFRMPLVPEKADGEALTGARDLLADFLAQLNRWTPGRGANPRLDMGGVPPATLGDHQ